MKMGEGGAFVAGAITGGLVGGGAGYQAGYNQRDAELQQIIRSLQNQLFAKNLELAQLKMQLAEKRSIPVISQVRKKLGGSQS